LTFFISLFKVIQRQYHWGSSNYDSP